VSLSWFYYRVADVLGPVRSEGGAECQKMQSPPASAQGQGYSNGAPPPMPVSVTKSETDVNWNVVL
jgi:hypothetical protein